MDSSKKIAIVTGANAGIGRELTLLLAKDGMKVFMACRSADKAHQAASYIRESFPGADVEILLLDLKTLDSVRKCASDFKSRNLPLHLLVNNAAATFYHPWYTAEGVGGSAQVSYFGHYVFTRLLEECLVAGAPSRVVNTASISHRLTTIQDPEDFLRDFNSGLYAKAKFAVILFTFELQRHWQGKGIQACAADPGAVFSDIWRRSKYSRPPWVWGLKLVMSPTWDGAIPVYHAATTTLKNTEYKTPLRLFARGGFAWWGVTKAAPSAILQGCAAGLDWQIRKLSGGLFFNEVIEVPANPAAYDEKLSLSLWNLSAEIAGLPA